PPRRPDLCRMPQPLRVVGRPDLVAITGKYGWAPGRALPPKRMKKMKVLAASVMTALLAVAMAVATAGPAAAAVTDVSGSGAFGESVNIKVLDLAPVTSGPTPTVDLPSSGGTKDDSLASVKLPGNGKVLTTKVLTVHTEGTTGGHTDGSKSSA